MNEIEETTGRLRAVVPGQGPLVLRDPLVPDECRWFNTAIGRGLVSLTECPASCFRRRQRGSAGPDHFETPDGKPRHLFCWPDADGLAAFNREYVPHIAAWARAHYAFGYDSLRPRFSYYRKYSRDLLTKRLGGSYETDVEFHTSEGSLILQIEAKKDARQVARLAEQMAAAGDLSALPKACAKEIEYVLDLAPRYLWVVAPGSIEPARHVFAVTVEGLNAAFEPLPDLPAAMTHN